MTAAVKRPKKYVYRSYRVDGKMHRDYLGTIGDPVTRVLVQADQVARASRLAASSEAQAELVAYASIEPCIRLVSTEANRLVRQLRYRFRRTGCRFESASRAEEDAMLTMMDRKLESVAIDRDSFDELVDRATDGNEDAVKDLKRVLRGNPGIYNVLGDLARQVQQCLIDLAAPDSIAMRESLQLRMNELRQQLRHDGSSVLEKLLIEQVVATMLDVGIQQIGFVQPHSKEIHKRRWERQLERSQKRHQAAIRSLVETRQMLTSYHDLRSS